MADYSEWLSELDDYAATNDQSTTLASIADSTFSNNALEGGDEEPEASYLQELEREMKLLHWHKLANEAALKAAIIRTKRLKGPDRHTQQMMRVATAKTVEAKHIRTVVEEEQNKPLEVTDDFVNTYKAKEAKEREYLEREVLQHIKNLKTVKKNLVGTRGNAAAGTGLPRQAKGVGAAADHAGGFQAAGGAAAGLGWYRGIAAVQRHWEVVGRRCHIFE